MEQESVREFFAEVKRIIRTGIFPTDPYGVEDILEDEEYIHWMFLYGLEPYEAAA